MVRRQVAGIASFLDITRQGLDLVGPEGDRAARIRQAHATFAWMAKLFDNAAQKLGTVVCGGVRISWHGSSTAPACH